MCVLTKAKGGDDLVSVSKHDYSIDASYEIEEKEEEEDNDDDEDNDDKEDEGDDLAKINMKIRLFSHEIDSKVVTVIEFTSTTGCRFVKDK